MAKLIKDEDEDEKELEKYDNIKFDTVLLGSAFKNTSQSYIIKHQLQKKKTKTIN